MTKTVDTLIEDIQELLTTGVDEVPEELVQRYSEIFANFLRTRFLKREERRTLRMSNAGKPCERQLWYELNSPEKGEKLDAATLNKFLTGDLIEIKLLFLSELAGHKVEGTQDTQEIAGILGHRDAVIDGTIVDTKSASTNSFAKFKYHELEDEGKDGFGYLHQAGSYLFAGQTDEVVTDKDNFAFFVEDKQHGHICLDKYSKRDIDYVEFMEARKAMVASKEIPERGYSDEPDGKSGNRKLGFNCSYCPFKTTCWPGLRQFNYKYGANYKPTFLTEVQREPRVPESQPK